MWLIKISDRVIAFGVWLRHVGFVFSMTSLLKFRWRIVFDPLVLFWQAILALLQACCWMLNIFDTKMYMVALIITITGPTVIAVIEHSVFWVLVFRKLWIDNKSQVKKFYRNKTTIA